MNDSPWIKDVTTQSFNTEVVERSRKTPVVVDFWADWCGPCRTLGPQLERLAQEGKGRFLLAKVDVDKNPELARMFQVQGIPMVLAIADGRLVDGFTGAQPERFLREFLDALAPPLTDDRLERARALADEGDADGARALLAEVLADEPASVEARVLLARVELDAGDVAAAKIALEGLAVEGAEPAELVAVRRRIELSEGAGDVAELRRRVAQDEGDTESRIALGRALIAGGTAREGLDELLAAFERDGEGGDEAKRAMIEAFEALGEGEPLVGEYRRKLQMLLF